MKVDQSEQHEQQRSTSKNHDDKCSPNTDTQKNANRLSDEDRFDENQRKQSHDSNQKTQSRENC